MATLKEQMSKDARAVFLNLNEFAEEMIINGKRASAQWDDTLQPGGANSVTDPTGWGVVSQTVILFVDEDDFVCPLPDEEFIVDGVRYTVVKAVPEAGILRLELERQTA